MNVRGHPTSALVLGGGGLAGIAWEAGVVTGLATAGVDLGTADRFVGTSAGSVVGTLLASRADVTALFATRAGRRPDGPPVRPDWQRGAQAFALLNSGLPAAQVRAAVGALALAADVGDEGPHVAAFASWLPVSQWPDRLLVTAVDAHTGGFVVWSRDSGVPLVSAVAASCAVPCVFPPVTVDGRRYIDGGVRSGTNADVAGDADVVVVLAPLAGLRSYGAPSTELDALRERASVVLVAPDAAAVAAFGPTMMDPTRQAAAFAAGRRQGAAAAGAVAAVWPA